MKQILNLIIAVAFTCVVSAQSPYKMSYQCVVRNNTGQLVANSMVSIRITLLQGSMNGNISYIETHSKTSNANGLVSLEIGGGTVVTGTFSAINWANGPYFLKTETDPLGGSDYSVAGTSQLLSVPYALYAEKAGNATPGYWTGSANGIYYDKGNVGIGTSATTDALIPLTVYANKTDGTGHAVMHLKSEDTWHTALSMFNGISSNLKEYSFILAGPSNTNSVPGTFGLFNHSAASWSFNFNPVTNNMAIGSTDFNSNTPKSKLHVFNGDINIDQIGSGIIMKSADGKCWKINVDNTGKLISTAIPCP